jgi:heat shock protein HslJ
MRITIAALALGLALLGCSSSAPVERQLIIAPAPVACAGDPPSTCLNVREPNGDVWLMRFDEIEGFAYEPGYTYRLVVAEPPLSAEQAVVPQLTLVRLLSEEPTTRADASPLARYAWRLQSISGSAAGRDWSQSEITAAFHVVGGWIDGFAGCDRYLGALAVNGEKLTISAPETSRELCAKEAADRQRTYLQELAKAQSYAVTGDSLELKLLDGGSMRFRAAR